MPLPHLPVIKDTGHAAALTAQHQDFFYLAAFEIQLWLSDLLIEHITEYAEKPDPADRHMQTGQAWRAFQPGLGSVSDEDFHDVINFLTRYAECENDVSTQLRRALHLVYAEHQLSGDFLGPQPFLSRHSRPDVPLMRRFVLRVCDWLDAVVHINTHILWVHHPACFHPDPEKRRLAAEQVLQPVTAEMDEPAVVLPYVQPRAATRRSRSVSPIAHSTAQSPNLPHPALHTPHSNPRSWPFEKLDESIMTFWPLLKLHNWTYADLWNVLSQAGLPLAQTPCADPRRLGQYCLHTLGLRKSGHGQTTRNSLPPGHELALQLLRRNAARRPPPLGRGPWS